MRTVSGCLRRSAALLFLALPLLALAAPDSRTVLGPANGFRLGTAEARNVELSVDGTWLKVTAEGRAEERRFLLPLAPEDRDLSAYRYLEADIVNRGTAPLVFTFWALSGNGWGGVSTFPLSHTERETLAPGATAKYRLDLWARYPGTEVYTPAVNPASIRWVAIACEQHRAAMDFEVSEVRAVGAAPGPAPDISHRVLVPDVTEGPPAPGRRVYQSLPGWENTAVRHVLTLPTNWKAGESFPIIVEYTGNRFFNKLCYSTGRTDQGNMAYGLSRGRDYICLNLPFISPDGQREQIDGFGDIDKDVKYCLAAVDFVCRNYGGDRRAVFFTGFSRGASACNPVGLYNDAIASLWAGFMTDINPGEKWPGGPGWRGMGKGWDERAARDHAPWFYREVGFTKDVHVDVEFLEDRPSTVATLHWLHQITAERTGAPVIAGP